MKRLSISIRTEARRINVEPEALAAFVQVESGARGFDAATGKIMIQFEPAHFARRAPGAPKTEWSKNKVERQPREWIAFNDAFRHNADAAMQSTSIGLGQVMGFHWKRLGYRNVGAMWDDAKKGEQRQIWQMAEFIRTDNRLLSALKSQNWHLVATYYNGAGYQALARRLGREPYNISMQKAYERFKRVGI